MTLESVVSWRACWRRKNNNNNTNSFGNRNPLMCMLLSKHAHKQTHACALYLKKQTTEGNNCVKWVLLIINAQGGRGERRWVLPCWPLVLEWKKLSHDHKCLFPSHSPFWHPGPNQPLPHPEIEQAPDTLSHTSLESWHWHWCSHDHPKYPFKQSRTDKRVYPISTIRKVSGEWQSTVIY